MVSLDAGNEVQRERKPALTTGIGQLFVGKVE